jgi:hypothetical protein
MENNLLKELKDKTEQINNLPFEQVRKQFERLRGCSLPNYIAYESQKEGLTNVEFLTGRFLHQYKLKNLLEI